MTAKFCDRCDKGTLTPVTVGSRHGNSGAGGNLYACPECVDRFPRQADADTLPAARTRRRGRA